MPAPEDPERGEDRNFDGISFFDRAVESGCFKKIYGILTCHMTLTLAILMGIS